MVEGMQGELDLQVAGQLIEALPSGLRRSFRHLYTALRRPQPVHFDCARFSARYQRGQENVAFVFLRQLGHSELVKAGIEDAVLRDQAAEHFDLEG